MGIIREFHGDALDFHHTVDERPNRDAFKMHTHSTMELYYFISGRGIFYVEGNAYPLSSGDVLVMRSAESHYISLDDSVPYERCAIHFTKDLIRPVDEELALCRVFEERELGKHNLFTARDFESDRYAAFFSRMSEPSADPYLNIVTNLFPLLYELRLAGESDAHHKRKGSETPTHKIVSYINAHLAEDLSLDALARRFYISKPQLCRNFKRVTGSSVWEFVTVKRLVAAQSKMSCGATPTEAATECGFGDYSVFYRAFRKHFGITPREAVKGNKES